MTTLGAGGGPGPADLAGEPRETAEGTLTFVPVEPEGSRREEILATAASLFASSGSQTSLKEIADACGILPGSLYHHFESKEALIIELVQRYRDDLDRLAAHALADLGSPSARSFEEQLIQFGQAIAACGVRHRAALLQTLYEPPAILGPELAQIAHDSTAKIEAAMTELLGRGQAAGAIRSGIDLTLLGDRLCQSMLHVGIGVSHLTPGAERVPEMRMAILLRGIGQRTPTNAVLDRSPAYAAAEEAVSTWGTGPDDGDDRVAHLRAVAKTEFGRRGYESTTMRDIAAAAGLSTGTVYRSFRSKDELLASIMGSYMESVKTAWDAVLASSASPLAKLDALLWVNIHVVAVFSDEFKIQLAWLRQSPPSSPNLDHPFGGRLRQIKKLVADGRQQGEFRLEGASADVRARCVFEAITISPNIVWAAGLRGAHALARDTVLRGAALSPSAATQAV